MKLKGYFSLLLFLIACSTAHETYTNYDYSIDHFEREPFIAHFKSGNSAFSVIGIHVKPDNALQELNQLDDVYFEVAKQHNNKNAVILGDFNASCSYLSPYQEQSIDLHKNQVFNWVIDHSVDTTSGKTYCAYDRIITTGEIRHNGFKIYNDIHLEVSDHFAVSTSIFPEKDSIVIGAFNIKSLGRKKIKKPIVISKIVSIALDHHILLLQEVRDTSGEVKARIEKELPTHFKVIQSKSLGRTNYKESYIYIYDTRKVVLASAYEFPDGQTPISFHIPSSLSPLSEHSACVYSSHPGCCSGHKGIARCENKGKICTNGLIQCRDGSVSKSCICELEK